MKFRLKTPIGVRSFRQFSRYSTLSVFPQSAKRSFLLAIGLGGILLASNAQTISRVAGSFKASCTSTACGDGGPASAATLYNPAGIAVDGVGNIYFSEYNSHTIRKIDAATGIISTVAGTTKSSCSTTPCGDGGQATAARLNYPRGIALDPDGNLYIADFSNHAIRKVDKTTGAITTVAGTLKSNCSSTPCGDGGQATAARLNSPTGLAFDKNGNMYIADYGNHAIRMVSKATGIITTVTGTLKSSCSSGTCGDGGQASAALLNGPSGLAFASDGSIYIAEYNNHTIRKISASTGIISTYVGAQKSSCLSAPCGDGESVSNSNSRLTSPFAVTLDKDDNLFIADASNAAIRRVDKTTGVITTVAGILKTSCGTTTCGDGGSPTSATLANPFGVAFNPAGELLFVEYSNHVVRKVNFSSTLPMKFLGLSALLKENRVELVWQTAEEASVDRYEIEKSAGGPQFTRQGQVTANLTGTGRNDYKWTDFNPAAAGNLYRVKAIDRDGTARYSPVVNVKTASGQPALRVVSNPVTGNTLHLQLSNVPLGEYELNLYSSEGKRVYSNKMTCSGGETSKNLTLPSTLSRGVYTLYFGNHQQELGKQKLLLQ